MQKIILIGHVGMDATLQQLQSGPVINFNLCHSEKWKDNQGQQKERNQWFSCSWFTDRTAILPYIKKGTQLYVEGHVDARLYQNKHGVSEVQLTCRVMNVQLLGGNKEAQPTTTPIAEQRKSGHYSEVEMKSDIPQDDQSGLPF